MKLKVVCRKLYDYVRYDLKEIAFPSSLPDPPYVIKRTKLTWKQRFYVLKRASRLYAASWVRDIGPDLRPNDYKKDEENGEKIKGENVMTKENEPSTLEDLAVAARGGMENLRPALQRVYMSRASAYRDALKSFIQGYQEGIQQVMERKDDSKSEQPEDVSKKGLFTVTAAAYETVHSGSRGPVHVSNVVSPDLEDLLQRCARNKAPREGKILHGKVILAGLQLDTLLSNIIINMYSKCSLVDSARHVFDRMLQRSQVSWNTIISAHIQHGEQEEALKLFMQMHRERTPSSEFTLSSILCACAAKSVICESKQLHAFALKTALDSNVYVGTALLDVYAKSELVKDARAMFDSMPERSAVTWSSMVAGYTQNSLHEEALMLFHRAQQLCLEQTAFTLSAALSACASLAALIEGKQVHSVLVRTGLVLNLYVSASLIDMYAKCGSIEEAYLAFSWLEEKNIVLWNAMLSGLSRHARSLEVMILFEKMQQNGMYPNEMTYISVLSACSHMGLVEMGQRYFDLMVQDPNVCPNVHHYSCMVDLLGRAGKLSEAHNLIERMPFDTTASMWGSLLGSCRIHKNLELAEVAAKHLFEIEPDNAGNHVLLSNIYAASKRWDEVAMSRKLLKDSGARKEMGKSWIEVKDRVHTFMVGEIKHPRIADIYKKLDVMAEEMKKLNYKAETEHDLHDVDEDRKEELLSHHSEKLALAFGLISLPPDVPIRIKKNLRICGDCHSYIKLISKITVRVIIVRDTKRFHHFSDGLCSCGDFW